MRDLRQETVTNQLQPWHDAVSVENVFTRQTTDTLIKLEIFETDVTLQTRVYTDKQICQHSVFTALHVMQTRYCDENSVCLSVCHTRVL